MQLITNLKNFKMSYILISVVMILLFLFTIDLIRFLKNRDLNFNVNFS